MKRSIIFLVAIALGIAGFSLGSSATADGPVGRMPTPEPIKPLAGCSFVGPNIGGVSQLSVSEQSAVLTLSWKQPKTRSGWSVTGYRVYRENTSTGVLQLTGFTTDLTYDLPLDWVPADHEGPIRIQVAAEGESSEGKAEEGCRAGQAFTGKAKVSEQLKLTPKTFKKKKCRLNDAGTHALVFVTGWYKANSRIAAPVLFTSAGFLAARFDSGADMSALTGWAWPAFKSAVQEWPTEVLDPGAKFKVSAMACLRE